MYDLVRRHVGVAVQGLARRPLPAGLSHPAVAGGVRGPLRHGRAQQRVLPAADAGELRGLAGEGAGGLRGRGQGEPVPDPHQTVAGPRGAGAPPDEPRGGPRRPAGPGPAPAATDPAGRRGPPERLPGPLPLRHPDRGRAPPRLLVDPRDPGGAGVPRRGPVLGRHPVPPGDPALAHHRLVLPPPAPGPGPPLAPLRPPGPDDLGAPHRRHLARRRRLVRVLQQRPPRGGRAGRDGVRERGAGLRPTRTPEPRRTARA